MPNKRTPEDFVKALRKEALDDEAEQPASRSVSRAEEDPSAEGFDVEMEKAEARAWRENMERDAAVEHPGRAPTSLSHIRSLRPQPRRPLVNWVAAAAVVALVGGGWISTRFLVAPAPAVSQGHTAAAELRRQAFDACNAGRWRDCIALFEDAMRVDPAGDADAQVKAARAKAQRELGAPPK